MVAPHPALDGGLFAVSGRHVLALYPFLDQATEAHPDPRRLLAMIAVPCWWTETRCNWPQRRATAG